MKKRRPRLPWKVVFLVKDSFLPLPEEKFGSEKKAYLAVNLKRELVREGNSIVARAVVYEWDADYGRWMTFERHDLTAEIKSLPPNEELRSILASLPELPKEIVQDKDAS